MVPSLPRIPSFGRIKFWLRQVPRLSAPLPQFTGTLTGAVRRRLSGYCHSNRNLSGACYLSPTELVQRSRVHTPRLPPPLGIRQGRYLPAFAAFCWFSVACKRDNISSVLCFGSASSV